MKKLLIGLLAFTLTLGVACKKEELTKVKVEQKKADLPPIGSPVTPIIGDNPFGLPPNGHEGIGMCDRHGAIPGVCTGTSGTLNALLCCSKRVY